MLDLLKPTPRAPCWAPGSPTRSRWPTSTALAAACTTDERMDVGIVWPPEGRPFLVGLYQWDDVDWIHWLRVWPMQIEFSTTVYHYFTTPPARPAPPVPQ